MINAEFDTQPIDFRFDVAIVAVGYERRCRWATDRYNITADRNLGLEFGFLKQGSYDENRAFFEARHFSIINGISESTSSDIGREIVAAVGNDKVRVFVDISSMSREMMANVIGGLSSARFSTQLDITVAYAPSKFSGRYHSAPIRRADPITPKLAGWSSQPEQPLGTIFGLGCEPGLALGALQYLEPNKAWVFRPKGNNPAYDAAMMKANEHIEEIFDVTDFGYEINSPSITRGRLEALINAVESDFRIIIVPFGPKIFAWLAISTVVFTDRKTVGVWTFSSKERAVPVDRDVDGSVVWHNLVLSKIT